MNFAKPLAVAAALIALQGAASAATFSSVAGTGFTTETSSVTNSFLMPAAPAGSTVTSYSVLSTMAGFSSTGVISLRRAGNLVHVPVGLARLVQHRHRRLGQRDRLVDQQRHRQQRPDDAVHLQRHGRLLGPDVQDHRHRLRDRRRGTGAGTRDLRIAAGRSGCRVHDRTSPRQLDGVRHCGRAYGNARRMALALRPIRRAPRRVRGGGVAAHARGCPGRRLERNPPVWQCVPREC